MRSQKGDLRKLQGLLRRMHSVFRWIILVNLCERCHRLTLMFLCWWFVWMLLVWLTEVLMWHTVLGQCQSVLFCQVGLVVWKQQHWCSVYACCGSDHKTSWWVVSVINTKWFFLSILILVWNLFCQMVILWCLLAFWGCMFLGVHFSSLLLLLELCLSLKWRTSCRQQIEVPVCKTSLLVCIFWWENWDHQVQSYYWNPCIPSCHLFFL